MSVTTAAISPATTSSLSSSSTATCINVKPGKNGYLPPESCDAILYYEPSFAAAILFCALYGLTVIAHVVQAYQYKKKYAWVLIMGGTWELLAFIFRTLLTRHQNSDGYDTAYVLLFLLAPIWINAFVYMTLGRLIFFFIPEKRLGGISAQSYGLLFVWLDIFSFLVQLAGAGMSTGTDVPTSRVMLGLHIYMGGIGLQELFVLIFAGFTMHLHRKIMILEREGALDAEQMKKGPASWRWLFYAMYIALVMITIRIIFRLAQFARGTDPNNPVLTHEVYEYALDAAPMFIALLVINIVHPGRILQGPDSEFPKVSRQEKKQLKQQKKAAKKAELEVKKQARGKHDDVESGPLPSQDEGNVSQQGKR
ncbi:hypothetical protein BBP40_007014 [Aspergillus hancockii]|nr:hypothetical protein BBP40_007014 [Aspergillus hancockii]